MDRIKRRAAYYFLFIAALIAASAVVYDFGMRTFEPGPYPPPGTEISMLHSMQVVVETFTATGYGSDSPWASPEMNLLVMVLDITGVGLFFLALPAVLLPFLQEALSPSPPTDLDGDLTGHAVVCSDTSRAETLIDELDANGIEHVFVEPSRDRALERREDGYRVIHGDPESTADLEAAHAATARALVADVSDQVDTSIVLASKEVSEDLSVISVVEDADARRYHELAGADHVLTPRQALGRGLASKLTTGVATDIGDSVRLGENFEVAELPVDRNSHLAGRTIAESDLRAEYGVNVIGAWFQGRFETPAPIDKTLTDGTVLLVAGEREAIDRLKTTALPRTRRSESTEVIVAGYGEVGQTVCATLSEANIPHTTIDLRDDDGVDVVGDVTEPEVLRAAGIDSAAAIVLALPDDSLTEFATLVVREVDPTTETIVRAEQADGVQKAYRAGADYVLSLATVSGRSIASRIVDDGTVVSADTSVNLVRTTAPALAGRTLADTNIRAETGCTVVVVERDGTVHVDLDGTFRLREDDELVVAGTDDDVRRFTERYASATE